MPILEKRKSRANQQSSVLNAVIRRTTVQDDVLFVREEHIPPGKYRAEIVGVFEARTAKGKDAVDLVYSFTAEDGFCARAKERYVTDGFLLEQLCDHWITSGLIAEGVTYADIKGITESVTVSYARKGALGSLQDRRPFKAKTAKSSAGKISNPHVDDDEDDDYPLLCDEEDDDDDYLPLDDEDD